MRQFIKRALQKTDELKPSQIQDLLLSATKEIDRLETVLDSLPRGILVCDTAHNLILANKAARRFLSIVSYEQARETIWSVISDERVAEFLANTLLSADKAEEREFDIDVKGMQRLLSVSVMPMVQERQVTGSLILVDDITERSLRAALVASIRLWEMSQTRIPLGREFITVSRRVISPAEEMSRSLNCSLLSLSSF